MKKKNAHHFIHKKSAILRLFIFIGLALFIQFISVISTVYKNITYRSKAAEVVCPKPTGQEKYDSDILPLGPHIAANVELQNLKTIRYMYNCMLDTDPIVTKKFIPVTVIFDLHFLKGNVETIKTYLEEMKKYGLYPIIRVATYMGNFSGCSGQCWLKPYDANKVNEDTVTMATNLSTALNAVVGFPDKPVVTFLNEVNLHNEWQGKSDPKEFAKTFSEFHTSMGTGNFYVFFPALSYGADGTNGMTPATFFQEVFATGLFTGKIINGISLNIYGSNFPDVSQQYNNQLKTLDPYRSYFYKDIGTVLTELGPILTANTTEECSKIQVNWVKDYIAAPPAIGTMACFADQTVPMIIQYSSNSTTSKYSPLPTSSQTQTTNTPTPSSTQTPTTSQTISPTPKLSPTSSVSTGPASLISLAFKLKFHGITQKPKTSSMLVKIKIADGTLTTPIDKLVYFQSDDSGIWIGTTSATLIPGSGFTIYVKGPKHLQKRICDIKPSETNQGKYSCSKGTISIDKSGNLFDLTGIFLLVGDIPPQDGIINASDLGTIKGLLGKIDPVSREKADVNMDGIVDSQDWSLALSTLLITNTDDEYSQSSLTPTPSTLTPTPTKSATTTPTPIN